MSFQADPTATTRGVTPARLRRVALRPQSPRTYYNEVGPLWPKSRPRGQGRRRFRRRPAKGGTAPSGALVRIFGVRPRHYAFTEDEFYIISKHGQIGQIRMEQVGILPDWADWRQILDTRPRSPACGQTHAWPIYSYTFLDKYVTVKWRAW